MISCLTVTQDNRLDELDRSIFCFSKQTFPEKELIIVHDADENFTFQINEIIKEFPGSDIHIYRHNEKGLSLGNLRNISINLAKYPVICQWDDDDLNHPHRLEIQYNYMNENKADFCFFTDQLHFYQNRYEMCWDDWNKEKYPMNHIQGTLMGKKELLPFYEDKRKGEDTDLLVNIFNKGYKVAGLADQGYLNIYAYTGKNVWDLEHHAAISSWKARREESLLQYREILQKHLEEYELFTGIIHFPHENGKMSIEL